MKKLCYCFLILFSFSTLFAQKKGTKKTPPKAPSSVIAKADNLTAEIIKGNFYLFINTKPKKDTIAIKTVDDKSLPAECVIKPFKAKDTQLYLLTWKEIKTTKTDLKTEITTTIHSEVYDVASKSKLFSNQQTVTNITEKVFLDRLKNASETQERIRREGFELIVTPEGDLIQKNKTQENKFAFNATEKKYIEGKTTNLSAPASKKKKS